MRILKIAFYCSILICFQQMTTAQENCHANYLELPVTGNIYAHYYKQYQGTPFFREHSFTGKLKLISGELKEGLELSYDMYKDELVYFNNRIDKVVLIDREIIDECWLLSEHNEEIHLKNYHHNDSSKINYGYMQVLLTDKISLEAKHRKRIKSENTAYKSNGVVGSFYEQSSYYYIFDNTYFLVPKSKRKLLKRFPDIKKELRKYMNSNRYTLKKEYQVVAIFKEINRIHF